IWYNLHALPKHDSLSVALYMTQLGQDARYGIWDHLITTIVVTIPVATGFSSHCLASHVSDHLPLFPTDHPYCIVEQALWGGGYILLLMIAIVIAVVMLWRLHHISQWQIGDRDEAIRQSVRLLLLVAAVLTLVGYVRGNAVNYNTVGSSRYLMCTWLTLPAIFWPLWSAGAYYGWYRGVFPALRIASTLLVGMVLAYGTFGAFSDVPQAQAENSQLEQLATYLQKAGMTRFYSSYWTCDRLIFLSQEKLICGDTWAGTKLRHGCDRYSAYPQMVMASSSPPFVYPVGDVRIQTLERELKAMGISYMHVRLGQYVIYKPSKSLLKTDPLALSC
ncbi:MAG TPA: hypothetical protein VHV10_16940, partial [Ktedonobacteraceae bacterium]|nr:hypothetical protein [Ktedonobacteraceae bacterium]